MFAQKVGDALGSLKSLHEQLDEMIQWENHILTQIGELNIPAGNKQEVRLEEQVLDYTFDSLD